MFREKFKRSKQINETLVSNIYYIKMENKIMQKIFRYRKSHVQYKLLHYFMTLYCSYADRYVNIKWIIHTYL